MIRHMNRSFSTLFVILALAGLFLVNHLVLTDLANIAKSSPMPPELGFPAGTGNDRPVIRIGVVSRFAPNIIYAGYQPIIDYLNRNGTFAYELRLSTSYQDAVDLLDHREVTASFLGAWITSGLKPNSDLIPLLAPLNAAGQSEFHMILVTGPNSDLSSMAQLAGRRLALPSPKSWSGNWLQLSGLPSVGLSVADLDSIHHFDHHQTVVWQILGGKFDAGVVKDAVAREYADEGLVAVARSHPIPGPPLVGNRNAPAAALEEISRLLLALDPADPGDRAILDTWTQEFSYGFAEVGWENYHRDPEAQEGNP